MLFRPALLSLPKGRVVSTRHAQVTSAVMAAAVAALPAQIAPGLQFAEMGKRHLPRDEDRTSSVAVGDVDGDGDLDMVCGNGGQNRLYLNAGGMFTDATATRMPVDNDGTSAVALGDVDGDGDLDMVCGNTGQNRLYLNSGGIYTDATATRMPPDNEWTNAVALGDVDGDGDLDLLCGNSHQNRLYLNTGGTFSDATAARMPVDNDDTKAIVLGDVDGDGDLDMVVGNSYFGQQNRLYLNAGGSFTDVTSFRMPAYADLTLALALGDVDGDGDLDLVCGNSGQNRLYLNNGGVFTDVSVARIPVDNDVTFCVALGDVDGDGDLDLVCGNYGQNRVYVNTGGAFTDVTATGMPVGSHDTRAIAFGDVDGDGELDLVCGNFWQQNRLYLNHGGALADSTATRMPVDNDATSVALGDVDGDGDLDLVCGVGWGYYGGQNRLYLNNGGTFTDASAIRLPVDSDITLSVALGDVDGDGDLDLVCGNGAYAGQQNRLYLNNGGIFTDATATRMPVDLDYTASVALGDVDGDGDLDLVCGNYGQNRLYLNAGGTFIDTTATRMPVDFDLTGAVALGDVDGDGDLDLVCGNGVSYRGGGQNRLYLNNGGTFTDATASRMPVEFDNTASVALGDLDGDGDLDMVCGNTGPWTWQNRLYLNSGGTFTDATASRMPVDFDNTASVALCDVDGDGDLDLVCGNYGYPAQNRLYLNSGGIFTDATASRMPVDFDNTASVALGDVDSDGDLDLAVSNLGQSRLYVNLQRQIDAPYLLRAGRPYTLEAYSRHATPSAFDTAFVYLSTMRQQVPMPPFGILGIDPMAALLPIFIPQPAGVGSATWMVPSNPAFAGIEVFAQAVIVSWPTDIRLTNVTADVILR